MSTYQLQTETITYGGMTAKAVEYGHKYGSGPVEWRISLRVNELGHGTLRAATLEGLYIEFSEWVTEALADQAQAAADQYATYDFSDLIDDDGYDLEGGW